MIDWPPCHNRREADGTCSALRGRPFNIRVNCVLPGSTDTRMMHNIEEGRSSGAPEKARETIVAGLPLKRYDTAQEIANLMLFLVSD